jgi:hypothetical protein
MTKVLRTVLTVPFWAHAFYFASTSPLTLSMTAPQRTPLYDGQDRLFAWDQETLRKKIQLTRIYAI